MQAARHATGRPSTFRAACERRPGTPIALRQGARVIEDSRRLRVETSDPKETRFSIPRSSLGPSGSRWGGIGGGDLRETAVRIDICVTFETSSTGCDARAQKTECSVASWGNGESFQVCHPGDPHPT